MADTFNLMHDFHVTSVFVDALAATILIRGAYPDRVGPDFREAEFRGVAGYHFEGDALGTILFEIVEVDPLELYQRYSEPMRKNRQERGGHAPWVETEQTAMRFINKHGLRGFALHSSIGFNGAVWAADYRTRTLTNL